jgi:hypothetical protein
LVKGAWFSKQNFRISRFSRWTSIIRSTLARSISKNSPAASAFELDGHIHFALFEEGFGFQGLFKSKVSFADEHSVVRI